MVRVLARRPIPEFDETRIERRVIDGRPALVYEAIRYDAGKRGARGTANRSRRWNPPVRAPRKRRLFMLVALLALSLGYWFPLRRWFSRWGTTADELARVMPGDSLIADPTQTATQAITVNAPPDDIWPWLVQMGYQRGGVYSYDWLDRLFGFLDRPSTTRILPEFQHLAVGDKILLGPREELTVAALQPPRALVLSSHAHGHGVGVAVRPGAAR